MSDLITSPPKALEQEPQIFPPPNSGHVDYVDDLVSELTRLVRDEQVERDRVREAEIAALRERAKHD